MIWESHEWKVQLAADATALSHLSRSPLREKNLVAAEKLIFVSAYAMRKLAESHKITNSLVGSTVQAPSSPRRAASVINIMNRHKISDHYDLSREKPSDIGLIYLLNQIIHSYLFIFITPKPKCIDGFFVSSDRDKERMIRRVSMAVFISKMKDFANDDPSEVIWRIDNEKEKIEVKA